MKKSIKFVLAVSVLSTPFFYGVRGGAQGSGIADELAVQGSSSTGGSATTIVGRVNGPVDFSVTGRFDDLAAVRLGNGATLAERTIRDLWNGAVPFLTVRSRTQLPDGRSRVLLQVPKAQAAFNGGQVRLRSGYNPNLLLDADPIVLR